MELKLRGLSNAKISEQLREEGFDKSSERSVNRVWAEARGSVVEYRPWTGEMIEELQRQQLAEITMVDDRGLKLKYRDRLLDKLMPRRFEQVGTVKQEIDVKQNVSDEQLARFIPVIADMVMGEQARRADEPHDQEGSQEPVDPSDADA